MWGGVRGGGGGVRGGGRGGGGERRVRRVEQKDERCWEV